MKWIGLFWTLFFVLLSGTVSAEEECLRLGYTYNGKVKTALLPHEKKAYSAFGMIISKALSDNGVCASTIVVPRKRGAILLSQDKLDGLIIPKTGLRHEFEIDTILIEEPIFYNQLVMVTQSSTIRTLGSKELDRIGWPYGAFIDVDNPEQFREIVMAPSKKALLKMIRSGRIDAGLLDGLTWGVLSNDYPDMHTIVVKSFGSHLHLTTRKSHLAPKVEKAISAYKAAGGDVAQTFINRATTSQQNGKTLTQ